MNSEKYIGLDVHQATISVAVMNSTGKVVMESILETKAATILEFFEGLRGTLSVTFEEGTWAAWLYDLLKPHVAKLVVCNPRKNALHKDGNKSDRIDARKLAELLYLNKLSPVYHSETGMRMLRELARSGKRPGSTPMTSHRIKDRRKPLRSGVLGFVSGVSVTFPSLGVLSGEAGSKLPEHCKSTVQSFVAYLRDFVARAFPGDGVKGEAHVANVSTISG
jgi:Transposase